MRLGTVVHPCRVNLFEKPCPRLWTTQEHRDLIIDNSIKLILTCNNLSSKLSLLQLINS